MARKRGKGPAKGKGRGAAARRGPKRASASKKSPPRRRKGLSPEEFVSGDYVAPGIVASESAGGVVAGGPPTEYDLVAFVERHGGVTTQQLAERYGLDDEGLSLMVEKLLDAQRQGLVLHVPGEGWDLPHRTSFRVGVLRSDRKRKGTVRSPRGPEEDIYVRDPQLGNALHGDLVKVRVVSGKRRGRLPEGRIVEVVERSHRPIRGHYWSVKKGGVVIPEDRRLVSEIYIPSGKDKGVSDGETVLVRLEDGAHPGPPRGRILVSLVHEGSLESDLEVICAEFELPGPHSKEHETEAAGFPSMEARDSWPRRRDLRRLEIFTIDPVDAKDFDDAVSLERLEDGSLRLGVHIADVSHYVKSGSSLDDLGAERGTSVYLPGRVIPMLPERLANDLCSLRPNEDRFAKTVFLTFSPGGELRGVDVLRSVIHSRRRFTYQEVQAVLDAIEGRSGGSSPPRDHAEFEKTLGEMNRLRARLRAKREERGALALDIPKLKLELDDRGEVRGLGREMRDDAHELIEEFMLAANEAVAGYLVERELPLVGRVHDGPDPEKFAEFSSIAQAAGLALPAGLRGASEITAHDLQKLVKDVSSSPLSAAIQTALLRTMGHAEYVPGAGEHFALATDRYCHFTSPIRRYPDLLVHQVLDEHFDGRLGSARRRRWWDDRLSLLAERSSELERRAENAERAMIQLRLIRYLEPMVGEEMDAWITSVHSFGFFVRVESLLVEGLVHVATLGDDFYEFNEEAMTLRGRRKRRLFRMGDRVRVELSGVDPDRREISFRWLARRGRLR